MHFTSLAVVYLLAAFVLVSKPEAKLSQPVCAQGGYCSCNVPKKRFTGLLDEASELKPALESAAFKKEVRLRWFGGGYTDASLRFSLPCKDV